MEKFTCNLYVASFCFSFLSQMWMNVWKVLSCVRVRVYVRTRLGATSAFVRQVTEETAHTAKVSNQC